MCTKITQRVEILFEEPMPFLYPPMLSCFSLPKQEWKPFRYAIQEKLKKPFSYIIQKKLKKPFSYMMFLQKWFDPYFHQGSFTLCSERNSVLKSIELCTPFLFLTCKHNIYFTGCTANVYRQTTDKLMFKSAFSTVRWIRK